MGAFGVVITACAEEAGGSGTDIAWVITVKFEVLAAPILVGYKNKQKIIGIKYRV